jgi:ABC-type enterochelin transport system permease subunit
MKRTSAEDIALLMGIVILIGLIVLYFIKINKYISENQLRSTRFNIFLAISWIILSIGLILTQRIITFDVNLTMLINAFGGIYFIYLLIWGSSNDKNK